jgi:hypothetical protein
LCAETLFFMTIATAIFAAAWAAQRPREALAIARRASRRMVAAALVAGAILAYPIWIQVAGPEAYHGSGFTTLGVWENVASFAAYPAQSLAGGAGWWTGTPLNVGEQDTFFGPALCGAVVIAAVWLSRRPRLARRRPEVAALTVTAAAIAIAALGPHLQIGNWHSGIPLPWAAVQRLPIFNAALPGRFALLLIPVIAVVIVVMFDEALALPRRHPMRKVAAAVAAAAFVPLLPLPLAASPRSALPAFITSGEWRSHLPPGTTVVSVPPSNWESSDAQRWQTATGYAFAIEGGYFLGPGPDGRSSIGPLPRPTSDLLISIARGGAPPVITDANRAVARVDLTYWHAGLVVLPDATPGLDHSWSADHDTLLQVGTELFGAPTRVADVWLWRIPAQGG